MTLRLEDIRWDGLFPAARCSTGVAEFAPLHAGASVLVTGAGGSIGSALSRVIARLQPRTLVLLDSSEQNLYSIHRELVAGYPSLALVPVIGSVADDSLVRDVFRRFSPRLVYHAAALKHVPLGEMNPFAVVQNNVVGTLTLARVGKDSGAHRLIMVSTDKSVNPRSIMGASKRLAELLLLGMTDHATRMTSIRLGNVLGSEGSVVPLFLEQIAAGGPITVTDPNVERYFLTMDETVHRILSALGNCPAQAAVAVPILDAPVKIADLARYLIEQAGAPHVEITFNGLRPGDKLQEQFIAQNETVLSETADGLKWVQSPAPSDYSNLLAGLAVATEERNLAQLLEHMAELVPEYQPSEYLRQQIAAEVTR